MVLFTACSSSEDGVGSAGHQPTMLTIYVYSPERATTSQHSAPRRAETGNVNPIDKESMIDSLQIWIYESESPNKAFVGYLSTKEVTTLNMGEGATYQLPVSDDFASRRPKVDVYALANVTATNCGIESDLNETTSYTALMAGAKIIKNSTKDYFGLGNLQTSVPVEGLPMAGSLDTQPVVGEAPALRVGTMNKVSTVQLTRAVSKLRFVFAKTAKTENQSKVSISSIKINEEMIPEVEYLFDKPQSVTTIDYNTEAGELLSSTIDDINGTADPTHYIYFNQEAQEYENLIDGAGLTVCGPYYLRESDKQLAGTITYSVDGGEEKTANFQMQKTGDFSRNHTWIVYAYYAGSGNLQVQTVYVKNWENREINHELYNW